MSNSNQDSKQSSVAPILYIKKHINRIVGTIPDISRYEEGLKIDAVLYHLQRLTAVMKADLEEDEDTIIYEEHQLALLLLDEDKVVKAFNIASGYFEEISKMDVLSTEENYLDYRNRVFNTIKIVTKESFCC